MFGNYSDEQLNALFAALNLNEERLDEEMMAIRAQALGDLNAAIDALYGIDNGRVGPQVLQNLFFKIDSGKDIFQQLAKAYRDSVLYFNLNDSHLEDEDREMAIQFQRASQHLAKLAAISFDEIFRGEDCDLMVQQIICEGLNEECGYHVRDCACDLAIALEKVRIELFEQLINWETIYHAFAQASGAELDPDAQLEFTGDDRPGLFADEF